MTRPSPRRSAIDRQAPYPALTERFTRDLAGLWGDAALASTGKLGLAVSGGPDSLAMLLLAHAALPGRIAAATVDHRLRPESAAEAAEVARICAALGVPHAVLDVSLAPGNLQAEARAARYSALSGWLGATGLDALATAHHADDQAETLLMRLNRASGASGLAGVRGRGSIPGGSAPLLRPLLGWRRAELAAIVSAAGIVAAQDPSNANPRFDRVRLRQALEAAEWLDIPALAASAAHLADADAALDWAAAREWAEAVTRQGNTAHYRPGAPRAIALRVIVRIVHEIGGSAPRGGAVARMHDALADGGAASLAGVSARATPGGWTFRPEPARRIRS